MNVGLLGCLKNVFWGTYWYLAQVLLPSEEGEDSIRRPLSWTSVRTSHKCHVSWSILYPHLLPRLVGSIVGHTKACLVEEYEEETLLREDYSLIRNMQKCNTQAVYQVISALLLMRYVHKCIVRFRKIGNRTILEAALVHQINHGMLRQHSCAFFYPHQNCAMNKLPSVLCISIQVRLYKRTVCQSCDFERQCGNLFDWMCEDLQVLHYSAIGLAQRSLCPILDK